MTLLERKLLGLSQVRLGPRKTSFIGLLQPVRDGVKLLFKQGFHILITRRLLFFISPIVVFILFITIWGVIIPWFREISSMKYAGLLFFRLLGIGSYAIIIVGWRRLSSFSNLGSLRGMLQNLSFEVAIIIAFFSILRFFKSILLKREELISIDLIFIWVVIWIFLSLMETNRAPFDLLEGERELIRGFNIEIGRSLFVLLFLSEYGMILVIALIFRVSGLGSVGRISIVFLLIIILIRRCFPRIRFDFIITIIWVSILPLVLILFLYRFFL